MSVDTFEQWPALEIRLAQEKFERRKRVERLTAHVERLFLGEKLASLRGDIATSLKVPQRGDYHNEGMYMDTHLDRILGVIADLYEENLPESLSPELVQILHDAAGINEDQQEQATRRRSLERYAFEHDISKKDCLTLKYPGGLEKTITWEEWEALIGEELANNPDPEKLSKWFNEQQIEGISYYQKTEDGMKQHGDMGADKLTKTEDLSEDARVLSAIRHHEAAFRFTKVNSRLYKELLGNLSEEDRNWAITATFTDLMGSLRTTGKPDLLCIENLLHSKYNYDLISQLEEAIQADAFLQGLISSGNLKPETLNTKFLSKEKDYPPIPKKGEEALPPRLTWTVKNKLKEIKDFFAPKLLEGPKIGALAGLVNGFKLEKSLSSFVSEELKKLGVGVEYKKVAELIDGFALTDDQKETLKNWFQQNLFTF